jgi:hypothetical protein
MEETKEMTFTLYPEQVKKLKEWQKTKKGTLPSTAIGGAYTVCFNMTSIGEFVTVTCVDGTKLDLTEYDLL